MKSTLNTVNKNTLKNSAFGKKTVFALLFFCMQFLVCVPLWAQANYDVRRIRFSGNETFSNSDLLDNMVFQQSSFITRRLQRREPSMYNSEMLELDIERITRFYQTEGFLNVQVRVDSLAPNHNRRRVDIFIGIEENKPILVDSIHIVFTDSLENAELQAQINHYLYRHLLLREGSRFVDASLMSDAGRINSAMSRHAYVYAETDFQLRLQPETNSVSIHYTVTPGVIAYFGATTITGNNYIRERHIRRQLRFSEGDRYNQALIDQTRRQINSLQLFRIVAISPQIDRQTQRTPIPISIQIQEMPRWMSRFGAGWGTEDKFRTFADVTYRGVFGGVSRMNFVARHSYLEPYHFSVSWIHPQFLMNNVSLIVNPYISRENEPAYEIRRLGTTVSLNYRINNHWNASAGYFFNRVTQFNALEINPLTQTSQNLFYNKSGILGSVSYSTARPAMSPVRGGSLTLSGLLNGYIFGGDFNFTRLQLDARRYQRAGQFTLAKRAMIGGIHSSDASRFIPVEDRFYSGGSTSNRGWARSMLGPTVETQDGTRTVRTPEGGKSIVEMNLEIRHPLFWQIELAGFVDAGNVWSQSYHFRANELWYAVGGGIRVNTPIGPVRLDVGVPVVGTVDRSVQFFLGVGQAF